jgi:threonine/homoserine/homoserine lactone efflux protein
VVEFLRAALAVKIIGVVGGGFLLYMGIGLIRETVHTRGLDFSESEAKTDATAKLDPVAAGALVSMGNPYWWVWWVTIGAAFLLRFKISLRTWPALVAFFIGHELGDLAWYATVSTGVALGRRRISHRLMSIMLGICGAAIVAFGLYLGISPFVIR